MEQLIHFSNTPVAEVHGGHNAAASFKPRGFWVSVEGNGDGWSDWCRDEEFRDTDRQIAHVVTLEPAAKILRLGTSARLLDFTERYGFLRTEYGTQGIRWDVVAMEFQGIIISPYQWECRLEDATFWYYGWDCASGCIWDPAAISSIRPATQPDATLV